MQLPPHDDRRAIIKTFDTPRAFPPISSKTEWDRRAQNIREQILVSAGLCPMPEKTPLNAHIFGKIVHDDYTIEKVYFESVPGFFVGGNLYRPLEKGDQRSISTKKYPAILNPHGHWAQGRLLNETNGSVAARCINFAKRGMIAFSWDLVGFNDTHFPFTNKVDHSSKTFYVTHRHFATNTPVPMLWNVSLMGLQTWNSIRAVDFLCELPDVDRSRIACTGASGGGTQTFTLTAIDGRVCADAPVVMVSHIMQGGCGCENMPGLRIEFSNMEIAAAAAPRPQLLVAASGDWTKDTIAIEGPAIASIYELFGAKDSFGFVRYEFKHNYNQTSREAVYGWFDKALLQAGDASPLKELPYTKDADSDLRVFPDDKLPRGAKTENELISYLINRTRKNLEKLSPRGAHSLDNYKKILKPAWKHTLQLDIPETGVIANFKPSATTAEQSESITQNRVDIGRAGKGDRIRAMVLYPKKSEQRTFAVLLNRGGISGAVDKNGGPVGLARALLDAQVPVLAFDEFSTPAGTNEVNLFYATYNRTTMQERVQDIATVCAFARGSGKAPRKLVLIGQGEAGLWAMLAAPLVDAVAADCTSADGSDYFRVKPELFVPGLRAVGDFNGIAALAAPNSIFICADFKKFSTAWLKDVYHAVHADRNFRVDYSWPKDEEIVKWVLAQK